MMSLSCSCVCVSVSYAIPGGMKLVFKSWQNFSPVNSLTCKAWRDKGTLTLSSYLTTPVVLSKYVFTFPEIVLTLSFFFKCLEHHQRTETEGRCGCVYLHWGHILVYWGILTKRASWQWREDSPTILQRSAEIRERFTHTVLKAFIYSAQYTFEVLLPTWSIPIAPWWLTAV